jgi:hypothetical protein
MWTIQSVSVNGAPSSGVFMSDGQAISTERGPAGLSVRLIAAGIGFLDFTDLGHVAGGPHYWALDLNGQTYWYDGLGAPVINISSDGTFNATNDGNQISGSMKALPQILDADIESIQNMEKAGLIPYRNIPNGGKSPSEIAALGRQYFPFTPDSYEIALAIYDWTTADFFRMDLFHLYRYTQLADAPLDMAQIAGGIWTANWPPYVPSDADFMNSFMMLPANSLSDVSSQLAKVAAPLKQYLDALERVTMAGKYALPRVSQLSQPFLYSGQVAISNLGESAFPIYFQEYPGNAGPVGTVMAMDLDVALSTFMAPPKLVTLKSFLSFTDSLEDAMHYQNGIVLKLSPPPQLRTWGDGITYITPLSDESDKIEYTFSPGASIQINSFEKQTVNQKQVTIIDMTFPGQIGNAAQPMRPE